MKRPPVPAGECTAFEMLLALMSSCMYALRHLVFLKRVLSTAISKMRDASSLKSMEYANKAGHSISKDDGVFKIPKMEMLPRSIISKGKRPPDKTDGRSTKSGYEAVNLNKYPSPI